MTNSEDILVIRIGPIPELYRRLFVSLDLNIPVGPRVLRDSQAAAIPDDVNSSDSSDMVEPMIVEPMIETDDEDL